MELDSKQQHSLPRDPIDYFVSNYLPGFNPRSSHIKDLKMVLDAALLNTQHYKVRIKGKWSNPGNGEAPSPTSCYSSC